MQHPSPLHIPTGPRAVIALMILLEAWTVDGAKLNMNQNGGKVAFKAQGREGIMKGESFGRNQSNGRGLESLSLRFVL